MSARPRPWPRVLLPALAAFALAVGAVACTAAPDRPSSVRAPHAATAVRHATVRHATVAACNPDASSLRPSGPPQVTSGSTMAKIRARGDLVAGVDQNTYHFGFRNPFDGQIEGFDIDMIKAVAQAIFGNPDKVVYKAIPDTLREPDLENGTVDIVAHTMTITCERLEHVDFSSVYFNAVQKVLVLKTSKATSLDDLRGQKVCATSGSDDLPSIKAHGAIAVPVAYWTDCLVLLQQGDVAAICTDNAILAGLEAQDPWTTIVGPAISSQPYGLAISKQHPDFVAFVNAVLEQVRTDGQWKASYKHWIGGSVPAPPQPQYAD